jgi:hypothetical protein
MYRWQASVRGFGFLLPPDGMTRKHENIRTMKTLILALIVLLSALRALAQADPPYRLDWYTFDGGGGTSTNAAGRLSGTIGQPDAGVMTAGNYTLVGGFWTTVAAIQTPGAPLLTVSRTATNTVVVSWPLPDTGWKLQATTNLSATPCVWSEIEPPYPTNATDLYYVEPMPAGQKYYRLHKP